MYSLGAFWPTRKEVMPFRKGSPPPSRTRSTGDASSIWRVAPRSPSLPLGASSPSGPFISVPAYGKCPPPALNASTLAPLCDLKTSSSMMPSSERRMACTPSSHVRNTGLRSAASTSSDSRDMMAASYASEGYRPLLPAPSAIDDASALAICNIFRATLRQFPFHSHLVGFPTPSADRGSPPVHAAALHGCPQSSTSLVASSVRPAWNSMKQARRRRASSTSSSGARKDDTSTGEEDRRPPPNADRRGASG
mmetsp:Transcript_55673/g.118410  ORF Transcript_55673/g.118410 Transcript_55673/m.118410 type:complete len:251 (-) Transcript_55673:1131-1883(-)